MSTISAAAVNELRKKTDLPLMECKKALTESAGDMDKAIELLRSWNAKASVKREGNETAEGRVGIFIDAAKAEAAILEMRCESAPSAKADLFIALVNDLAKHVASHNPADVDGLLAQPMGAGTVKTRVEEVVGLIREKMVVHKFQRLSGGVFGEYIHHDGMTGVLLHCLGTGGNAEALRDVCAHVAAMNPQFLDPKSVDPALLAKEVAFIKNQIAEDPKNVGKPANIIEKIAEGKVKTWLAEICLTEQMMANTAKYPNTTVSQVLAKMGLTAAAVVRYKVGAVSA
ncbi:MAG: translation elongation factor Ts [Fimbriiglobus sp.]